MKNNVQAKNPWILIGCASAILMLTMGARQSQGLFIKPLGDATGLDIVSISFAMAVGQFVWGAVQPFFGALADKKGPYGVLVFGTVLLSAGLSLTVLVDSQWFLMMTVGILSAAGAGAGSFSVLIGATSGRLQAEQRSMAGGIINAGGSLGQFIFAPLMQAIINSFGWVAAMLSMAVTTLVSIPLARVLCYPEPKQSIPTGELNKNSDVIKKRDIVENEANIWKQVKKALHDRSYLCLHAGFFTCGFHVAFLITHLPGEVALSGNTANVSAIAIALIGLFNIGGSLIAGALGNYYRMKYILAVMYASRTVMIAIFLVAPKTAITFYIFAAAIGFTWLATVPPTAGLVGKLFGVRYMATLFGLTLFTHQVGGFLGAWLGGIAVAYEGNYQWIWYADMLLALLAALVNMPIREPKLSGEA